MGFTQKVNDLRILIIIISCQSLSCTRHGEHNSDLRWVLLRLFSEPCKTFIVMILSKLFYPEVKKIISENFSIVGPVTAGLCPIIPKNYTVCENIRNKA